MRKAESVLAWVTIGALIIYAPVETIYSWKDGLLDPFYIIDVIAMGLLLAGVVRTFRARPGTAPALLAVGWAWAAANFWRSYFDRVKLMSAGGSVRMGSLEMRFVAAELAVALACLTVAVVLLCFGESELGGNSREAPITRP